MERGDTNVASTRASSLAMPKELMIKPLFWYVGSKRGMLRFYYPFFKDLKPDYCIDYFGGGASMSRWLRRLYPDATIFMNELDPGLYELYTCIKEQGSVFKKTVQKLATMIREDLSIDSKEKLKAFFYDQRFAHRHQDELAQYQEDQLEAAIRSCFKIRMPTGFLIQKVLQ
jgi:site-specific DNA-adenine methylase